MADTLKIRVISDIDRFVKTLDAAAKVQVPFAIARALTMTARDAQTDVRGDLPKKFTLRNNWVSSGIRIESATKGSPVALVGSLEPFMARQETGGEKTTRGGHRVATPKDKPTSVIPRGRRPSAVRGKKGVFVQKTKHGTGIFWRPSEERYPIIALYWLKHSVKVKPRLGFKGMTAATVQERFATNFVTAISQAMGHWG